MRLTSDTHFQYADAEPVVRITLLGDGRISPVVSIVPLTAGPRPMHPHALARRPMR
jgi:hypothetical protein